MDPAAAAPKKFMFSLKKRAAETAPQDEAQSNRRLASGLLPCSKTSNGRAQPSPVRAHALGFDASGEESEKPKTQLLLSISDGQLEVEGGVHQAAPRVIPCRNPLPLSNYRVRITSGQSSGLDSGESSDADRAAGRKNMNGGETNVERQASGWGLQEVKKGKATRGSAGNSVSYTKVATAALKTEPGYGHLFSDVADSFTTKTKVDLLSEGRVTDEEAAASLLADARGERASYRVVPLLARNSVLAEIRQKYRGEVERSQRQLQQAGEPDKVLLQRELEILPDAPLPSSSTYELMPVEEFGAAMLRGMGLKSIPSASQPKKRKAYTRAGLGSEREIDRLRERLEQQGRREDAAKRPTKVFIPLKTGGPTGD